MVTSTLQCDHPGCDQTVRCAGRRGETYDQQIKLARRMAVVTAEALGWYVSPHGQTLDLCPAHRGSR